MNKINWFAIRNTILIAWLVFSFGILVVVIAEGSKQDFEVLPFALVIWLLITYLGVKLWDSAPKIYKYLANILRSIYLKN